MRLVSRLFTELHLSTVKNIPVKLRGMPDSKIAGKFPLKNFELLLKRRSSVNLLQYFVKKGISLNFKAFSRKFIAVFRKKGNKLKF